MAKGSGLSFDSDRIGLFLHNPTVINSFPEDNNHRFHHNHHRLHHHPPKWKIEPMEATDNQFSMNLNSTGHHDDQDLPPPSNEKRTVIDEMDFFAEKRDDGDSKAAAAATSNSQKKDLREFDFNVNTGLHLLTGNTSSDQSMVDDGISQNSDDKRAKTELSVLQADLERMKAENQRLRDMLNQITSNYNTLQMHLMIIMQQQQQQQQQQDQKADDDRDQTVGEKVDEEKRNVDDCSVGGFLVPRQFMDLGPADQTDRCGGGERSMSSSEGRSRSPPAPLILDRDDIDRDQKKEHAIEESPDSIGSQGWAGSNKVPRLNPSRSVDQATEATMRKARVSVRARSEAPMMSDGCQWRKYGQKMAKGNPCPRAYYRCTMAAGCPVRKQVQRCAEDRTILITTYEGNHNHPLPPAAMAMASTTSSAARMLLSGPMQSADGGLMNSNFLSRNLLPYSSSMASISASAPFPTVTLDLTQTPNPLQFQRPPNQFHVPFPNTSQNYSGSQATALLPQIFGQTLYNQSKFSGLQMSGKDLETSQSGHHPPPLPPSLMHQQPQNMLADTVTAITADPSFTAALAAAITSIIGGTPPNNNVDHNTNVTTNSNNNGSVSTSNNNSSGHNKVSNSSFPGN